MDYLIIPVFDQRVLDEIFENTPVFNFTDPQNGNAVRRDVGAKLGYNFGKFSKFVLIALCIPDFTAGGGEFRIAHILRIEGIEEVLKVVKANRCNLIILLGMYECAGKTKQEK